MFILAVPHHRMDGIPLCNMGIEALSPIALNTSN